MPPINQEMLKKERVVAREYRNRKIGGFLKELKLTEGRGTGLPIIHRTLEENGSPPPVFETDNDRSYFLSIIKIHPLAHSILGQEDDQTRTKDKALEFKNLSNINPYLRLSVSAIGDKDREAIRNNITPKAEQLLQYCVEPKSREAIFDKIGLYNNTKNFGNHFKPLIDVGWLQLTLPDKPTSRDQRYLTSVLGNQLLTLLEARNTKNMQRIQVVSSNIASVGYDAEKMILEIEFHHGAIHQYKDVPKKVYEELMHSAAIGSYFMHNIRENRNYQKN